MTVLYFIMLIGSFLVGYYDNKDMTFFCMVVIFGIIYLANNTTEKIKRKRRIKNGKNTRNKI